MAQKGVVFNTTLTTKECADLFRVSADRVRGVRGKLYEATAKLAGNGDATGFYTPNFESPFAGVDGRPDFAVGITILKFNGGGQGNGTPVHMYIDEQGAGRTVQLVSKHGLTGGMRSTRLVNAFLSDFQASDPTLERVDGNV